MTSVYTESPIINVPNPLSLGGDPQRIIINSASIVDLTVTGSFNGGAAPVGPLVTTTAPQFIINKTFGDSNTTIVNFADNTIGIRFSANGTPGTTSIIELNQTTNRTYSVPDSGADCAFVMSTGAQTIGGIKEFTDPLEVHAPANNFMTIHTQSGGQYVLTVQDRADAAVISFPNSGNLAATDVAQTFTGIQTFSTAISLADRLGMVPITDTQTVNATTTTVLTLTTTNDNVYMITAQITARSGADAAAFQSSVMAKNVGGALTLSTVFNDYAVTDAALATASIAFDTSGADVLVRVTGIAATNITWRGAITYAHG